MIYGELYSKYNFISIVSSLDTEVFETHCPHKNSADNVLVIDLDPTLITNPTIYGDREFKEKVLFCKNTAKKIIEFINRIDKSKPLKINCAGGNSRSGTIAWCINEIINKDKYVEDYNYFLKTYSFIRKTKLIEQILIHEFEKQL